MMILKASWALVNVHTIPMEGKGKIFPFQEVLD